MKSALEPPVGNNCNKKKGGGAGGAEGIIRDIDSKPRDKVAG